MTISILDVVGAAVRRRLEEAVPAVIENIRNEDTDPKAKREIQLSIVFKPDDYRELIDLEYSVKTRLAADLAPPPLKAKLRMDVYGNIHVVSEEVSGQMIFSPAGEVEEPPELTLP